MWALGDLQNLHLHSFTDLNPQTESAAEILKIQYFWKSPFSLGDFPDASLTFIISSRRLVLEVTCMLM